MPPESFGTPTRVGAGAVGDHRSAATDPAGKARKQPTDELRQRLAQAIERFKKECAADAKGKAKSRQSERPELVITAKRKGGGERAEILSDAPRRAFARSRGAGATGQESTTRRG